MEQLLFREISTYPTPQKISQVKPLLLKEKPIGIVAQLGFTAVNPNGQIQGHLILLERAS